MSFFVMHSLLPFSYGIYMDLLAGNLPVCFVQLRLMLESLVKCYVADTRYWNHSFFQDKLDALEQKMHSFSKLARELGKELGVGDEFYHLWCLLSGEWVHSRGIMNNLVRLVTENSAIPAWSLPLPMSYTEDDMTTLEELRQCISKFRNLSEATVKAYRQQFMGG